MVLRPAVLPHLDVFLDYYTDHAVDHTTLMPGASEVLAAMSGRKVALCTNKSRRTTLAVLSGLGITDRFDAIVSGGDTPKNKPSPDPLLLVAELLGVSAEELVMVGDGPQDILAARAVRAYGVGVRGGILPIERLVAAAPDVLLDDLTELPALLTRLDQASKSAEEPVIRARQRGEAPEQLAPLGFARLGSRVWVRFSGQAPKCRQDVGTRGAVV